jgi:hypothetical protein
VWVVMGVVVIVRSVILNVSVDLWLVYYGIIFTLVFIVFKC